MASGIGGNQGRAVGRGSPGEQVVDHGRQMLGAGKGAAERGGEAVADAARGGSDQDDAVAEGLRRQFPPSRSAIEWVSIVPGGP